MLDQGGHYLVGNDIRVNLNSLAPARLALRAAFGTPTRSDPVARFQLQFLEGSFNFL
jgi:hypothetical protein